MALSDEQIRELAEDGLFFSSIYEITRAIEAEVRKDDEALIRQMRNALSLPCDRWNATQSRIVREAIDAADAWLEGN